MPRNVEQFKESLAAAPGDEFKSEKGEVIRVPKELRENSSRLVGNIMRRPERGTLELERQQEELKSDIEVLEEQKEKVPQNVFEQSIVPLIEGKTEEMKRIQEQIETQKVQEKESSKKRKKGEVKTALVELAERKQKEKEEFLVSLPYLPKDAKNKVFDFMENGSVGKSEESVEKKMGRYFIDAYLAGQPLPAEIQNKLQGITEKIKKERRDGLEKLKDKKAKELILTQIEQTPLGQEELEQAFDFNLRSLRYTIDEDLKLFALQYLLKEEEISEKELKVIVALSLAEVEKGADKILFDWITKQEPRLTQLQSKSHRRPLSGTEKKEAQELWEQGAFVRGENKEKRTWWHHATLDEVNKNLGQIQEFTASAQTMASLEDEVRGQESEKWQGKLARKFEDDFNKIFTDFKDNTAKREQKLDTLSDEIKGLDKDVENAKSGFNNDNLWDKKNIETISRLKQLKTKINSQKKEIREEYSKIFDYINGTRSTNQAFKSACFERRAELRKLLDAVHEFKNKGVSPLFNEINKKQIMMIEQLKREIERAGDRENSYFNGDFFKDVNYRAKEQEVDQIKEQVKQKTAAVLKFLEKKGDDYNSAHEALNDCWGKIDKQETKLTEEEAKLSVEMQHLTEELDQLKRQKRDIEKQRLVWGKAEKMNKIDRDINKRTADLEIEAIERKKKHDLRMVCVDMKRMIEVR